MSDPRTLSGNPVRGGDPLDVWIDNSATNPVQVAVVSGGGGGGGAVTEADGANVALGTTTDTPQDVVEDSTSRTGISLLKGIKNYLRSLLARFPSALGTGGGLKVDGSGTALPVSGTVTANAGTNLNTSALALEAGNLATLTAKDFATQTTLAAVLAKLTSDPATQTTLASILTALSEGGELDIDLDAILSKLNSSIAVTQPDVRGTGTIDSTVSNAALTVNLNNGEGVTAFAVTGLTASGATLTIEASDDAGATWASVNGIAPGTGILFTTLTTDQQFRVNTGGRTTVRLRVSATGTGNITVAYNTSSISSAVALSSPLPPGTNNIGWAGAQGALTNRSGTITTGGTVQSLVALNTGRRYFFFANLSADTLWLNPFGTASASQPSIPIAPFTAGQVPASLEWAGAFIATNAISIFGATTNDAFVCWEG